MRFFNGLRGSPSHDSPTEKRICIGGNGKGKSSVLEKQRESQWLTGYNKSKGTGSKGNIGVKKRIFPYTLKTI